MMFVFVYHFISAVAHGWQHLGRDLVNLRLRRRGSVAVRFCHRPSNGLTGIPQLSRLTAHTCVFYWREEERTVSVFEYFFAKYGFELQHPHDPLVFFAQPRDNYNEVTADNLFPMEVLRVDID